MSWYDAIKIYRERTGNRHIPTLGSPELGVVQQIYNEIINPTLRYDLEPEPERPSIVSPLAAKPRKLGVWSGPKVEEITPEQREEEENRKRQLVAALLFEQAKKEREAAERREQERIELEEMEMKKRIRRATATPAGPRVVNASEPGKKYRRGRGRVGQNRVSVKPAQIISFD
jgi:hypothetical protein